MKKLIRILRKRSSGGFTLVEMIVSVALLAVLMGGMMIFISPVIQSYNDNTTDITAQNTTTCVQEYISRNVRYAYKMAIFENTNYDLIKDNDAYKAVISSMNEYCAKLNGGATAVNKTYVLNCLSLRYNEADKRYVLYRENVNMASNGALDQTKSKKVFADCLYNGLHIIYDIYKPMNGDFVEGGTESLYRNDALGMTFSAYNDEDFNYMVFQGSGITELRQIKNDLANGYKEADRFVKIYPDVPLAFRDTTAGERDIYIYYVARNLGGNTTT